MTFTDLCNEIKKKNIVDRVSTVLFVVAVFSGLIGFSGFVIRYEIGRDLAKRNEELMLENIIIKNETEDIIIAIKDQEIEDLKKEKDKEIAVLTQSIVDIFNMKLSRRK